MSDRESLQHTIAWYGNQTNEELEYRLHGGPPGNKDVEGALIGLGRSAAARHEKWTKGGYRAALGAAVAAIVRAIMTALKKRQQRLGS